MVGNERRQLVIRRAYIACVLAAGTAAIIQSLGVLYVDPLGYRWLVLAALTLFSGSFTVKVPGIPSSVSVSETFVIICVLLFGPAPATIIVALEGLIISLWLLRSRSEAHRVFFNMAGAAISIWIASHVFFLIAQVPPLAQHPSDVPQILLPLVVFTTCYFLLNSWLVAFAVALERGVPAPTVWRRNYTWLSVNYFGGASVAALLVPYTRDITLTALAVILPLLVITYLISRTWMGRVADAHRHLEQLNSLYLSTIETLAMAIDAKDQITHGHIRRVQVYAVGLARTLGLTDDKHLKAVEAAALLHDMGKLAVPEYILNKPGKLTPAEFEKMKLHASVGADILSAIDFPYPVVPIVRHHHENWDGTGYPAGLRGSDIPIGARILSVVDCFDALTSDRPYRPRLSDAEALEILNERRGSMYDPAVVDAFVHVYREIAPQAYGYEAQKEAFTAITGASQPLLAGRGPLRFEDISASTEEMLTLYDLARGLAGQMNLSDAGDVIAKHLRRMLPASLCVFYVYDSAADDLVAEHAAGENASLFSGIRIPLGQRLTGWVGANRMTILNSDPVLDLGEVARSLNPRPRSCLSTPLLADSQLVGVLTLYSNTRDAFTEDHRRIVEVVSRQVSQTVRHAVQFERERAISLRDTLTGLPNREHLRRFFSSEELVDGTLRGPLSILFVDVDGLKDVNNRFGRKAGDDTLEHIVGATRKALRGADVLFRYGSDELVVVLAQTDSETSAAVCERIENAVSEIQMDALFAVSVSIGMASAPADGRSLDELVASAKARLATKRRASQGPPDSATSVH